MSTLKKAMHWLGLGPDDEYDQMGGPFGPAPGPASMAPPTDPPVTHLAAPPQYADQEMRSNTVTGVRTLGPVESTRAEPVLTPVASDLAQQSGSNPRIGPFGSSSGRVNTVRPIPAGSVSSNKPVIVTPRSFNDAQEIGDKLRSGSPVVMDLQGADRELSRRLIDFASGACYALKGHMEKTAEWVYLLRPADVEISPEDRIELREKGLHDG